MGNDGVTGKMIRLLNFFVGFFDWWLTGLCDFLPVAWREYLCPAADRIYVTVVGEELLLSHTDRQKRARAQQQRFSITERQSISATLKRWSEGKQACHVYGLLAADLVLTRQLSLPLAASDDLRDILAFELERKTPFNPQQVYYDFITEEALDEAHINVRLILVQRETVDLLLVTLRELGIRADVLTFDPEIDINLLPPQHRPERYKKSALELPLLTGLAIIMLATALYLPLLKIDNDMRVLENMSAQFKAEVAELSVREQELDVLYQQSHFLENKRGDQISELEIIRVLTELLPEDTYLSHYVHSNGRLQLQGGSGNASALIAILEDNDGFSATQFHSPIKNDPRTQKERFYIISNTKKSGTHAQPES